MIFPNHICALGITITCFVGEIQYSDASGKYGKKKYPKNAHGKFKKNNRNQTSKKFKKKKYLFLPTKTKKTNRPTLTPSDRPTLMPSDQPSLMPSDKPTLSDQPSSMSSDKPSLMPSDQPTLMPSLMPSESFKPTVCVDLSTSSFSSFADLEELKAAAHSWVNGGQSDVEAEYGPIEDWNVECVTDMTKLFCGHVDCEDFSEMLEFNGDISKWNVGRVTNTLQMFRNANEFNVDISKWDVGQLGNMNMMFREADAFNVDISKWNVEAATAMRRVFYHTNAFNINLCEWGEKADSDVITIQMFDGSNCPNEDEPPPNWCFSCN